MDLSQQHFDSENDEKTATLLKNYNTESKFICLNDASLKSLSIRIANYKKLERLYLKYNIFNEIPAALSGIKELELLDMEENLFDDFPNTIRLGNLKRLYLKNNGITFAQPSSDKNNTLNLNERYPKLEELNLSSNMIAYIPMLQSRTLKRLYLQENKITTINSQIFIRLPNLIFLTLTFNNLKEINNDLGELKNLGDINLGNNIIETFILNKECLKNLITLDLNYNQITEFKLKQSVVPRIRILSLTNNGLSIIPSNIYGLHTLEMLDLSDNKITEIHDSISNLIKLTSLKLSGNEISKIPESIGRLTDLKDFKINFNYLDKNYVPSCVIHIIRDMYGNLKYEEYMESKTKESEVVKN